MGAIHHARCHPRLGWQQHHHIHLENVANLNCRDWSLRSLSSLVDRIAVCCKSCNLVSFVLNRWVIPSTLGLSRDKEGRLATQGDNTWCAGIITTLQLTMHLLLIQTRTRVMTHAQDKQQSNVCKDKWSRNKHIQSSDCSCNRVKATLVHFVDD